MSISLQPRRRDSARLIVFDAESRLLLFRFALPDRDPFWATPGGALNPGEDFATAARRELREETGFDLDPGASIFVKNNRFEAFGEKIIAEEHYFVVHTEGGTIDISGHEAIEQEVMTVHRWFNVEELENWSETIFPDDIARIVQELVVSDDTWQ